MGLLLSDEELSGHDSPGVPVLVVRGETFRHSGVSFWTRLLDEWRIGFPECSKMSLLTVDQGPLDPDKLFPVQQLERDAENLNRRSLESLLKQAVTEWELLGPPQPVRAILFRAGRSARKLQLPRACLDATAFPFFLGWLLQWGGVHPSLWNASLVRGEWEAGNPAGTRHYRIGFELNNREGVEGLIYRRLDLTRE